MKLRSILTTVAAGLFLLGAVAPVSAAGPVWGGSLAVENENLVQDVSHWVKKCKIVRVKTAYGWKKVQKCKKVWPKHSSSAY